ncbi:MAG: adenylate kinase [Candidatus Omnitrophica bacterium]|nr:adenylate kinase [Candidatus Omnitrophota bacterium]
MRLVFVGPPGAGKGTHAKILSNRHKIPHISTGDILRARIKDGSDIGKIAKSYVESGGLVPDEVVIQMMKERLQEEDTKQGFILDGFPRTLRQAEAFDRALKQLSIRLTAVVDFKASLKTVLRRLTGRRVCPKCNTNYHVVNMPPKKNNMCDVCGEALVQRKDDLEETIRKRLEVYDKDTQPLVDYYRNTGLLQIVNADLEVEDLDKELESTLKSLTAV